MYEIKHKNGGTYYYYNGKLHRENDLPAIERIITLENFHDGHMYYTYIKKKEYCMFGNLHRSNGLPAIERTDGHKEYWVNGDCHRDNGLPAKELPNGAKYYYVRDELHRENGLPAIELPNGNNRWFINGIEYTKKQAIFIHKMKLKRKKIIFRSWFDITYEVGNDSFKKRLERDIKLLENEIGYNFGN